MAVVGMVFTLVFLTLLILNGYRQYVSGPREEARLTAWKQQLLQEPDNETLMTSIRERDRHYRAGKLRQLDFAGRGGLLLLLSGIITFGAFRWLARLKGIAPEPSESGEAPHLRRRLGASRMALAACVMLLAALAIFLKEQVPTGWFVQGQAGADASAEPGYASPEELSKNWHRFRGFGGAGVVSQENSPTRWDGAGGSGIRWKTPIPLPGYNSPVVWEDRIFLTGASWEKREVYCFDAATGAILWAGGVPTAPMGDRQLDVTEDTGLAASTLTTDGVRAYAIFATGDLAAFDFNGRLLWHQSLGIPENLYGHAVSLEVWRNRVLVQYDQGWAEDGRSRLYAFDGATGNIVWEVKRPVPNSWTTPAVIRVGEDFQLITVGNPWVIAYDPEDGEEIWRAECVRGDVAASPILAGEMIIAVEPEMRSIAIRTGGTGNITDTHVAWENWEVGPTIVSPVAGDGRVLLMDTFGVLFAVNTSDGKFLYEYDFGENVNASPTLVNGRLYVLSIDGNMFIGTPGDTEFALEATNPLDEACYASPAFMPGRIYIRGTTHLYCIENETN